MIHTTIPLDEQKPYVTLTTYVLPDSSELLQGKKRPVVLICPGGGYQFCSDRESEPVALRFNAMGYHAFVLRYSVYYEGKGRSFARSGGELPVNPNSVYPAALRDIGRAFLTLHAHAAEWLLDMERVTLCGFSAGAHNCAMFAVSWQDPVLSDFFGVEPKVFKPAAMVLGYGSYDYRIYREWKGDPAAQHVRTGANMALLGTTTPTLEQLEQVSPCLRVNKGVPPMFLWATAADALVPVEQTTLMGTALARAGIPFEIHIFEEGGHGLSLADQSTSSARSQIDSNVEKWMGLTEAWLLKRFALPLPEKTAMMLAMEEAMKRAKETAGQ